MLELYSKLAVCVLVYKPLLWHKSMNLYKHIQ